MSSQPLAYNDSPNTQLSRANVWSTDASSDCSKHFSSSTILFNQYSCEKYSSTTSSNSEVQPHLAGSTLSFHNLCYNVTLRKRDSPCTKVTRKLLDGISGMFRPGMNAIMGPTGCGKTTLLDNLAGRKDKTGLTGDILVDGMKQPNNFSYMSGYVTQDDQIMGTLTVRENLMFSANMRLPTTVTKTEKKQKVAELLEKLGLTMCADTKVGTEFLRGVSGGERKRTCIGMELLVSRGVLFLDEPTTGLDAYTANSVMSLLQRLSTDGLTVIFSIHQPRYNIYKLFDTLMLLARGRVIFHGKACRALDFFRKLDFNCEEHNNPPDFFLDVINGDVSCLASSSTSLDSGCAGWDACFTGSLDKGKTASPTAKTLGYSLDDIKKGVHVENLADAFKKSNFSTSLNLKMEETLNEFKKLNSKSHMTAYSTSFFTQLFYLSKRTIWNALRNPLALIAQVAMMVICALITGVLFFNLTNDDTRAIQDRAGAFFLIILIQMFGNLSAVELFLKERCLFLHESRSGFYRVSAYFLSKIFCDLIPLRIIPLILFSLITYFMLGLRKSAENFFIYLLNLFLVTLSSAILTFTLSSCIRFLALANILLGLIIMIMMVFGGLLINVTSIPAWLRWLEYLSIVRYGFKTFLINELKDAEYKTTDPLMMNNTIKGNAYLKSQDVAYGNAWDLWYNMMALAIGALLLSLLCYIRLRFMVWKK